MAVLDSWHGIIGSFNKKMNAETADFAFLITAVGVYLLCHLVFFGWIFVQVYLKRCKYFKLQQKFKSELRTRKHCDRTIINLFKKSETA